MSFIVAIDGPTSSGKSTLANIIANDMGFINIQTGAMYRCVALQMLRENIQLNSNLQCINDLLERIDIEFMKQDEKQIILLNGENVTEEIRKKHITDYTSEVASIKEVRHKLLKEQRKMAGKVDVVVEGRDIGTNVFPNANIKFFLTAKPIVRAKRKQEELKLLGEEIDLLTVLQSIYKWDKDAINRKEGPLKRAKDSIYIDNSEMTTEELKDIMLRQIREKYNRTQEYYR